MNRKDIMRDIEINRPTLGPFMSVVCFRYLNDDAGELAGPAMIIDAGRQRGHDLIEEMGVMGSHQKAEDIQAELNKALGVDGTRLCLVKSITEQGDGYEVVVTEYPSPTYTMGVLIGAISAISGTRMHATMKTQPGAGVEECVFHIEPV